MKSGKPVYYWDTCIFLSLLTNDRKDASLIEGIEGIARAIDKKECLLVTSTITEVEVLQGTLSAVAEGNFQSALKRRNVTKVSVNSRVTALAREIRDFYNSQRKLKTPDAIHLATAILYSVDELHTNDPHLLNLVNPICNKYTIKICRPPLPRQAALQFSP